MKNRRIALLGIVCLLVGGVLISRYRQEDRQPAPLAGPTPTSIPSAVASTVPSPTASQQAVYYYPIDRYVERLTVRPHGQYITAADRQSPDCGDTFLGYHAGDDLEATTSADQATTIPVYAIADGTVVQVGTVGGYGGLIVLSHTIESQVYTSYYGHVDLKQGRPSVGDMVTAGQQLSVLGDHCSAETSNERKHLHFAIRKGRAVDVRGYVETTQDLAAWVDPRAFLSGLKAKER